MNVEEKGSEQSDPLSLEPEHLLPVFDEDQVIVEVLGQVDLVAVVVVSRSLLGALGLDVGDHGGDGEEVQRLDEEEGEDLSDDDGNHPKKVTFGVVHAFERENDEKANVESGNEEDNQKSAMGLPLGRGVLDEVLLRRVDFVQVDGR